MSYEAVWRELDQTAPSAGRGFVARRIVPEAAVDLRLALGYPGRDRALLLRASLESIQAAGDLPVTRAVAVRPYSEAGGTMGLEMALTNRAYADVFSALTEDVVTHVIAASSEAAAVAKLVERVHRWQAILDRGPQEGLSPEAQRGLWGELWILREHVIPCLGPHAACEAWIGPERAVHDLRTELWAVEVKTTLGPTPTQIRINGEYQLDTEGLDSLILAHVQLEQGGGESLPALVASVRERLREDVQGASLFEHRLVEAGYYDLHAAHYADWVFRAGGLSFFRVVEGFPRLIPALLPPGVGGLSYAISIAACEPFRTSLSELEGLLCGGNAS